MARPGLSPRVINFDQTWASLSDGISKIITMSGVKGMPLVEDVYRLCTAHPKPFTEELYNKLKKFMEDHVQQVLEQIQGSQSDVLHEYIRRWHTFATGAEYCDRIFRYLNQHWIKKLSEDPKHKLGVPVVLGTREIHEVITMCLLVWHQRVYIQLKPRLVSRALALVEQDRNGEVANVALVRDLMNSLVKLGSVHRTKALDLYQEDLEAPFLQESSSYYARESASFLASNGVSAYLEKAENRIKEEKDRATLLDLSSHDKLAKVVDLVLIDKLRDQLTAECDIYLSSNRVTDLNRLYRLLSRIDGFLPALDTLQKWIITTGFEALKALPIIEHEDPQRYIDALLSVYITASRMVKQAFFDDPNFVAALDKACHVVVNETPDHSQSKSPEFLARYCDSMLRKGKQSLEESQLDEKLTSLINLFKYIEEKDVFQKFYAKLLARRLILGISVSDDAERTMISGLKAVCGFEYVNKLTRMLTDITLSLDMNDTFREHMKANVQSVGKLDFSVIVLTAGSWPLQGLNTTFNVPQELEGCVKLFLEFYSNKYQGRKLSWLHHLSKGEVRALPGSMKRQYEFSVSNFQLGVLLVFNSVPSATTEVLQSVTGLTVEDLEYTLASLVSAKVLLKKPPTKEIKLSDEFAINSAYTSKRMKVKITPAARQERPEEAPATYKGVEEDRKMYLQAAIVRIMKARKELKHVQLVQEVIDQSKGRFQPSVPVIKKCIESLIEKEFLRRHDNESDKYSYIA